ncbi:J domain-containing protein [Pimelobacter simplex]|uniref:J domain-containing protein n=1 Tax=Nocardioides simplex TaxID=2045 RepID=UPI00366FBD53
MSTNLYDLLDVDESAGTDEIRAAWKRAIADLDPTERRFRAYNDAAGVLLDPERRAAYDAELAAERAAETEPEPVAAAEPEPGPEPEPEHESAPRPAGTGPSTTALIAVGVAALLALVLAVVVLLMPGALGDDTAKAVSERNARAERAAVSAEGAAEQMVAPVLSYNHTTMAADLDRHRGYMTTTLADKQARAWPEITKEAESQKIVVDAKATGTALTRVDPAGDRATVVVYVDQYVTKDGGKPFVLQMWATFVLVRADGSADRWQLDNLCTDASCDKL